MDDFIKKYTLAYFKTHNNGYSLTTLARELGVSIEKIDDVVSKLIEENALTYSQEHMLKITEYGRLMILDKKEDFLENAKTSPFHFVDLDEVWPVEKIYLPKNFLSKL